MLCFSRYDVASRIPDGSILHAGENAMALVRELAMSPFLGNSGPKTRGRLVFFDVLGLFFVVYPEYLAVIVNTLVVLASIVCLYFGIAHKKSKLGE